MNKAKKLIIRVHVKYNKSNRILLCFILLYFSMKTHAQNNMVFNPSFELMDSCPYTLDQTQFATGWSSFRQSPDYFNNCASNNLVSTPLNCVGYQQPRSGFGYIGMQTFFIPGTREIIGCAFSYSIASRTNILCFNVCLLCI
jgi:hypothetical protein